MDLETSRVGRVSVDLATIFDTLDIPVVEWDADGTIRYVNARFGQMIRRPGAQLLGQPFYETLFPGALSDQWDPARLGFIRSRGVSNYLAALRDADGAEHVLLWSTVLKTADSGRVISIIGLCLDITDVAAAMKAVGQLARTLNGVYGYVSPL